MILEAKRGAVLFVVESRDLADQQCDALRRDLPESVRVGLACGGTNLSVNGVNQHVQLGKRNWAKVVGATAHGPRCVDVLVVTAGFLKNLIPPFASAVDSNPNSISASAGVELAPFGLVVFDEAHHATGGKHAFVHVASSICRFCPEAQIVGLTASPYALNELRAALGDTVVVTPRIFLDDNRGVVDGIQEETFKPSSEEVAVVRGLAQLVEELEERLLRQAPHLFFDAAGDGSGVQWDERPPAFGTRHRRWAASLAATAGRHDVSVRNTAWTLAEVSRAGALAKDLGAWAAQSLVSAALAQAVNRRHARAQVDDVAADLTALTILEWVVPLVESAAPAPKLERLKVRGGRLPSQTKQAEQNNKRTNTKVKT